MEVILWTGKKIYANWQLRTTCLQYNFMACCRLAEAYT